MTGIYDKFMTERERRCAYDAEWTRRMEVWLAAWRRKDTAATDAAWRAMRAREAELMGGEDGG